MPWLYYSNDLFRGPTKIRKLKSTPSQGRVGNAEMLPKNFVFSAVSLCSPVLFLGRSRQTTKLKQGPRNCSPQISRPSGLLGCFCQWTQQKPWKSKCGHRYRAVRKQREESVLSGDCGSLCNVLTSSSNINEAWLCDNDADLRNVLEDLKPENEWNASKMIITDIIQLSSWEASHKIV